MTTQKQKEAEKKSAQADEQDRDSDQEVATSGANEAKEHEAKDTAGVTDRDAPGEKSRESQREKTGASGSAKESPKARPGYRLEEDLLGIKEVPEDAYFGVHTVRAVENFQLSRTTVNMIPEFIHGMVQVKKAAAMANRRLHTLPEDKAKAIVWACDQILEQGRCMDQFPLDVFQGCLLYTSPSPRD